MDNSPYAPPKTSSPHQKQPPYHPDKWSQRKLLLLTFTPSSISFLSALLMLVDEGFIQLAMLGTPLVAFLIAIATAINFAQTKAYSLTGQLIMCQFICMF